MKFMKVEISLLMIVSTIINKNNSWYYYYHYGWFPTTDMQTPPLRSSHLNIKNAQCIKNKFGRKISCHTISCLGAAAVQNRRFGRPKIPISSKVAKFAGQIGIDLALIFCIYDFSFVILNFWDMIDLVYFFAGRIWRFYLGGKKKIPPPYPLPEAPPPGPGRFRIDTLVGTG